MIAEFDPKPLSKLELAQLRAIFTEYRKRGLKLDHNGKPFYDPERDGVTYSALSYFRQCREKSRLNLNGVTTRGSSIGIVFGTVVHGALQAIYDAVRTKRLPPGVPDRTYAMGVLRAIERQWKRENPRASKESMQFLEFSMALSEAILPRYLTYWKEDFFKIKWLELEKEFRIPIQVSLRGQMLKTFVRGRMDGNYFDNNALWLFETKTKYSINEETISDILPHALQVHIYLWAMEQLHKKIPKGVRYNIIRRPALRQRKNETFRQFAVRCGEDVIARPDWYFVRMDMTVNRHDLDKFEGEFNDLLVDFFSWWYGLGPHYKNDDSCENRYGRCAFLGLCGRGEFATFYRRDTVFRELEDV